MMKTTSSQLKVVFCLCVYLSIKATVSSGSECNGHGVVGGAGGCGCEPPYAGDSCEICATGYYGNPLNGQPCYLSCPSSLKLLAGSSMAGLGLQVGGAGTPPTPKTCLWVVLPPVDSLSPDLIFSLQDLSSVVSQLPDYDFHLQFTSDNHTPCNSEVVSIHRGLPPSLTRLSHTPLRSNDSAAGNGVALTGSQLLNSSLLLRASFVSVQYYSSNVSAEQAGFNLVVSVSAVAGNNSTVEEGDGDICRGDSDTQHLLGGLYHHSSVYDPCSDSLWVYGGRGTLGAVRGEDVISVAVNVTGEGVEVGEVEVVEGEGVRPPGRYLHTAVLVECSEVGGASSQMLVFGGVLAGGTAVSPELWRYSDSQWTQLQSVDPTEAVAGHAAVLVKGKMLVVGGVGADWSISPNLLQYDLSSDTWEVLDTGPFGPAGVYGHSAVYDQDRDRVLVFGGYRFSHPSAAPSSALFSLSLSATPQWSRLVMDSAIPSLVFPAGVLLGGKLVLFGGLMAGESGELCPSNQMVLILLHAQSEISGKYPTVTLSGPEAPPLPLLWGSSAAAVVGDGVILTGGFGTDSTGASAVVWPIRVPNTQVCSAIESESLCLSIPDCELCSNDGQNQSSLDLPVITCQNRTEAIGNRSVGQCRSQTEHPSNCSLFADCHDCMSAEVARQLGCLWCVCSSGTQCVSSNEECSGEECASFGVMEPFVCVLEACEKPSCRSCLSEQECNWLGNRIELNRHHQARLRVRNDTGEWGCFSDTIVNAIRANNISITNVPTCFPPCNEATSCHSCATMFSPNGGSFYCVWASSTQQCISSDMIPLLCSDGHCGPMASAADECPTPCSQYSKLCHHCLQDSRCAWVQSDSSNTSSGECLELAGLSDVERNYSFLQCPRENECVLPIDLCQETRECVDDEHGFSCPCLEGYREQDSQCVPICRDDCGSHGTCVSPSVCSCDLGFVGEYCQVPCACNGHSDCANASSAGRKTCLNCLHNTQGVHCEECQPFFVGEATNGGQCVPCLDFCHGNSEVCLRMSEYTEALARNISLTRNDSELSMLVLSGPSAEEAVCVNCARNSVGDSCSRCLDGFFRYPNITESKGTLCIECMCNGHGDYCDTLTGNDCNCYNNTQTFHNDGDVLTYQSQCNQCVSGYAGNPINNRHCYKLLSMNTVSSYTLPSNYTTFLALSRAHSFSNINVKVHLLVEEGVLDVYITSNNQAIEVISGDHGEHILLFNTTNISVSQNPLIVRDSSVGAIQKTTVDKRLTVVIPYTDPAFSTAQYFTVFARADAKFHSYFRQDLTRFNFPVFIGMFLCCFFLALSLSVFGWKAVTLFHWRMQVIHSRAEQQNRERRPFEKVTIYLTTPISVRKNRDKSRRAGQINPREETDRVETDRESLALLPASPQSRKGAHSLEMTASAPQAQASSASPPQRKPGTKVSKLNTRDLTEWPVCQEPTRNGKATVGTVFVQYPSRTSTNALGVGSALFHSSTSVSGTHMQVRSRQTKDSHGVRYRKMKVYYSPSAEDTSL